MYGFTLGKSNVREKSNGLQNPLFRRYWWVDLITTPLPGNDCTIAEMNMIWQREKSNESITSVFT